MPGLQSSAWKIITHLHCVEEGHLRDKKKLKKGIHEIKEKSSGVFLRGFENTRAKERERERESESESERETELCLQG